MIKGENTCKSILVFTDSLASARHAVDPSVQSGQFLSLVVVHSLHPWLEASANWVVQIYQVSSKEEWWCHKEAHDFASDLKVSVGTHVLTSLNYLCAQGTKKCLDCWTTLFGMPSFCGNQFLELTDRLDKPMKPKYTGGGAWLSRLQGSPGFTARCCCAILGHAPIGSFNARFFPHQPIGCPCGAVLETRPHILGYCNHFTSHLKLPISMTDFIDFMKVNPRAFTFNTAPSGVG
ncbi:hypothetical protein P691DRAFT_768819 [Macrolepiota fuliginosa MF-IS2]|uniref:Uncharacterized protein n=1 Tax=Macrolepiota fuliginosa MF-IS2 TaxID=1400762 RepID=A0A9P5WWZ8_9AGAR|nr:hypothetical protein P691DRAFT_768819 [Macrolepiota fuliginosa MF-IS2]